MGLPTSADVHVDSALTNISVAYIQSSDAFVARQVFKNVPVLKQSDKYYTYSRADFNRDEAAKRAPGTESKGSGFRLDSTPNYYADVWAWHHDVPTQTASNMDAALMDPMDAAAVYVTQKLMIRQEAEFASTYMIGGVWTSGDYDGVNGSPGANQTIHWSDTTNGDPIGDIRAAIGTILANTGVRPNTLVLGYRVMEALEDHPDIVDRIKYSGGVGNDNPATVNPRTLAQLFRIERVLISEAVKNSAKEGLTESSDFVIGKDALLCYAAPQPGLMVPSAGYTFSWTGFLNAGNEMGIAIKQFYIDELESDRVEGQIAMDMKVVGADLGFFWDGIVT